jgi:hypothetical protein
MRIGLVTCLVVAIWCFMNPSLMFGHHGNSDYDLTNQITLHVTVTDFLFINPHSFINFTVKDGRGQAEEWQGELPSPGLLFRRAGWTKDTVKPGDQITVIGSPAKNGSHNMQVKKIVLANGQEMPGTMVS